MSKNKSNDSTRSKIEWPTNTHFTMDDLFEKYPDAVEITLRFQVKKAEEAKEVVLIGKVKPPIGRPRKVYAVANPSKELLAAASAAGVISVDASARSTVPVADVKAKKKVAPAAVAPTVPAEAPVAAQVTV